MLETIIKYAIALAIILYLKSCIDGDHEHEREPTAKGIEALVISCEYKLKKLAKENPETVNPGNAEHDMNKCMKEEMAAIYGEKTAENYTNNYRRWSGQ